MSETRKTLQAQEKIAILRRLLVDKAPISALADEYQLHPN